MNGEKTANSRSCWSAGASFLSGLCLLGLLPLVLLTAARILHVERSKAVVLAESFMPYLYVPVYVIILFAILAKRKILGGVCAALIVCHVVWVAQELRPAASPPAAASKAPKLKVFSQNVLFNNPTPERVAETIKRDDADVVMLQELTDEAAWNLKQTGALDPYPFPFRYESATRGTSGIGIWSKIPFDSTRVVPTRMPALRVTITFQNHPIVLWDVHTATPLSEPGDSTAGWRSDLAMIKTELHRETGSVIAAGDFNSVWSHRPYREIVTRGYHDVHIDLGRGYQTTWPVDSGPWAKRGGLIRIDHVLTRGAVRATSVEQEPGLGSDHRGTFVTIAVL